MQISKFIGNPSFQTVRCPKLSEISYAMVCPRTAPFQSLLFIPLLLLLAQFPVCFPKISRVLIDTKPISKAKEFWENLHHKFLVSLKGKPKKNHKIMLTNTINLVFIFQLSHSRTNNEMGKRVKGLSNESGHSLRLS